MTDPFASFDKTPQLKFPTVGTEYKDLLVLAEPKEVHAREYSSDGRGALKFWKRDGKLTEDPIFTYVIEVDYQGVKHAFWAEKGTEQFRAIREARKEAGVALGEGCRLTVSFYAEEKGKGAFPKKLYKASYTPPKAADVFESPAEEIPY